MKSFVVLVALFATLASAKRVPRSGAPLLSRIIHGDPTVKDELPYQLMLVYGGQFACGATLISQQWAVTAAHCVDKRETALFSVRVNLHEVSSNDYSEYKVSRVIKHSMYNSGNGAFPNNIALLYLSTHGADLSANVISLASGSNSFAGDTCVISGYGETESGSVASVLMKTDVTVLDQAQCENYWGSNILSQHACVMGHGPNGSGACNADSGGPMVCGGVLAGVTSWGPHGCVSGGVVTQPSVYTRITDFRNWINNNCNCL